MRRSAALLIAIFATVAILFQNSMAMMAFTWAVIHGAGVRALLAFVPAAIGLAVLCAGYVVLKRQNIRGVTLVFSLYAAGILVANEVLLPTPLKSWRGGNAAAAVNIRSVKDELLLSARGNPIGIRLTFEAVVPRTGQYLISASSMSRVGEEMLWPLNFGSVHRTAVAPPPTEVEGPYDLFEKGVVYTFTADMTPSFLLYDEKTNVPCLIEVRTKYISEEAFLAALAKSRQMKYRGEVHVSGPLTQVFMVVKEFVTLREYDVEAMYRTIEIEGRRRCG